VYLGIEPTGTVIVSPTVRRWAREYALPSDVAADELDADWKLVRSIAAIGDTKYGDQNTDGSKSMRDLYEPSGRRARPRD